jgi:hypothetical protein
MGRLVIGKQPLVILTDPEIIRETFKDMDSHAIPHFVSKTAFQVCIGVRERGKTINSCKNANR